MARPATRRSSDDVKARLIVAARELYEAGTFDGTTTKGIAAHADVAESVLFRHFGTKDALLAAAIVAPFEDFLADFSATWEHYIAERRERRDAEQVVVEFVRSLHERLVEYRPLLRRLLAASMSDADVAEAVRIRLDAVITAVIGIAEQSAEGRGAAVSRASTNVRAIVAMVTSMAILDDWFAPVPADPDRVTSDISTLIYRGLAGQ
jgi:AcrR family transcriptional regulator